MSHDFFSNSITVYYVTNLPQLEKTLRESPCFLWVCPKISGPNLTVRFKKIPGPSCSHHQCCISKTSSGVGFRFTFQKCILGTTKKRNNVLPDWTWDDMENQTVPCWHLRGNPFFSGIKCTKKMQETSQCGCSNRLYHLVRKIILISESLSTFTLRCDGVSIPNKPYLEPGLGYIYITHRIHVWYIYLHLVDAYGKWR